MKKIKNSLGKKKTTTRKSKPVYTVEVIQQLANAITGIPGTIDAGKSFVLYPYCLIRVLDKQLIISVNLNFNFSVSIGILSRELQKLNYEFNFTHGFWVLDANLLFDNEKMNPTTRQVLSNVTTERTFLSRAFGDN